MIKKLFFYIGISLLALSPGYGQRLVSFNEDPSIFIQEFSQKVDESGKMDRQLLGSFQELWNTGVFPTQKNDDSSSTSIKWLKGTTG